jgi:histidine triad (HIT) family protein
MSKPADTRRETNCPFCRIADDPALAVTLYRDAEVVAFLDRGPIRPGHTQIIPRTHVPTFELLSPDLLLKVTTLGQQLALRMKALYGVERVAFLFTGGDVAHVHAHVVPLHDKTDITSARYITSPDSVLWGSAHLTRNRDALLAVRDALAFEPSFP